MEATAARPPPWLGLGNLTLTRPSASYRVTTGCLGPTVLSSCTGVMMLPPNSFCNASSFLAYVVAFVRCSRWPVAHLSLSRTLESLFLRLHSIRLRSRPHPLQMLLARTNLWALLRLVLLPLLAHCRQHLWWSLPRLPFRLRLPSWTCQLLLPLGLPHPNRPPQMAPSPRSLTRNARLRLCCFSTRRFTLPLQPSQQCCACRRHV